jgi:hypothetical protein
VIDNVPRRCRQRAGSAHIRVRAAVSATRRLDARKTDDHDARSTAIAAVARLAFAAAEGGRG